MGYFVYQKKKSFCICPKYESVLYDVFLFYIRSALCCMDSSALNEHYRWILASSQVNWH